MITVTKPFFPPLKEYEMYLQEIWQRGWITNNGPVVNELELKLKEFLKLDHLLYTGNGTIALQIAIKALGLKGEIITTPFSYIATTSSIVWENCCPKFVDIDQATCNIDPQKIEAAITDNTSAIVATHVFGNPCDISAIQQIAERYSLKVIYDAAHGFGSTYKGRSIYAYGDISTASFHATKVFHTVEGGAVVTSNPDLLKKMAFMRNFGHTSLDTIDELGINGKNSEVHAAMGLVNLKYVSTLYTKRKELWNHYQDRLQSLTYQKLSLNLDGEFNYAYFPVIFKSEEQLIKSVEVLNANWIYPRRYFYPSLNRVGFLDPCEMPVSDSISRRVLCLPLYHGLEKTDVDFIARLLLRVQNN